MEPAETAAAVLKKNGWANKKFRRGQAFGGTKGSLVGRLLGGESASHRIEAILFR
jgi:hypothetical protein